MGGGPARIETLEVENFRALRDFRLTDMTPLTVLIGPNGSGKSTIVDVFAFLSECFATNLGHAWEKRGGMREIRSKGAVGPVRIRLRYREEPDAPLITYHLAIDERQGRPEIAEEWLQSEAAVDGKPVRLLDVRKGRGKVMVEEGPEDDNDMTDVDLASSDLLAVSVLGQLTRHPRVSALRKFIADWHVSRISVEDCRARRRAGPQERLGAAGDNLGNVLQFLSESQPDRLNDILKRLTRQIPRIERAVVETALDGRLLLQVKDEPFEDPVIADFASDGTLKMLAYLIFLSDPVPPGFTAIESPEHFLHPQLLERLAEACGVFAETAQLLVTTHSPYFVNALKPEELRVVWRDRDGFAKATSASSIFPVPGLVEHGSQLGYLWMQDHFGVGNPTVRQGEPSPGGA